jgi:two-component sensor histidine kinase
VLLQEVHHRVKNNLQVISSLINMQVQPMAEGSSRSALEECTTRVEAIALIHEKLYQSRDYAQIPFAEYARGLATNIFRSTGVSSARITLGLEIEDISLPVDQAIPCGLILNELITNALKHAFPEDRTGTVRVELRKPHACEMLLAVFDDGVGMAPGLSFNGSSTLGMELVSTLVNQLEGRLEIDRGHGTAFRITFPLEDISAMNGPSAVA